MASILIIYYLLKRTPAHFVGCYNRTGNELGNCVAVVLKKNAARCGWRLGYAWRASEKGDTGLTQCSLPTSQRRFTRANRLVHFRSPLALVHSSEPKTRSSKEWKHKRKKTSPFSCVCQYAWKAIDKGDLLLYTRWPKRRAYSRRSDEAIAITRHARHKKHLPLWRSLVSIARQSPFLP